MAGGDPMCYHWSMRNLRKIFESLGFFKRSPVLAIKDMAARINIGIQALDAIEVALTAHEDGKLSDVAFVEAVTRAMSFPVLVKDDAVLFNRIIDAVVAIAEGDDEKASKKAATTEG